MATVTAPRFDDVKVGDALKPIVLPPISRHQLALYCGGSGDHNPIHVDIDFAKKFGFKDVFAHGMLTMGMTGSLLTDTVGDGRLTKFGGRFTSQVWPGDTLTATATIEAIREEGGEQLADFTVTTVNQDGREVFSGHATARLDP